MKLSLIVPCYNEEACIDKFYKVARAAFKDEPYKTEYIFVDDGSTDSTFKHLRKIYKESADDINVISFSRNFGKEAALYAGLKASTGDYVCFIDADLQQRPELVVKMVTLLEKHQEYDCIATYAKKRDEKSDRLGFVKHAFYKLISAVSDMEFVDGASDFRCFRRCMADAIIGVSEYHRFSKGLFSWVGFKTRYLPYEMMSRQGGESKWSTLKLFRYALDGMIAFSEKPLRFPVYLGGAFGLFGLIYLIFYIIVALAGNNKNNTPLAMVIALMFILTGVVLIALGVMGEYIGKIHIEVKKRPVFIERTVYMHDDKPENLLKIERAERYEENRIRQAREKKRRRLEKQKREQEKNEMIEQLGGSNDMSKLINDAQGEDAKNTLNKEIITSVLSAVSDTQEPGDSEQPSETAEEKAAEQAEAVSEEGINSGETEIEADDEAVGAAEPEQQGANETAADGEQEADELAREQDAEQLKAEREEQKRKQQEEKLRKKQQKKEKRKEQKRLKRERKALEAKRRAEEAREAARKAREKSEHADVGENAQEKPADEASEQDNLANNQDADNSNLPETEAEEDSALLGVEAVSLEDDEIFEEADFEDVFSSDFFPDDLSDDDN